MGNSSISSIEETIRGLSDAELDEYPLGVVRLDPTGVIHFFNKAEQRFVNRSAQSAIGLNYFRELAPCAAVRAFEGRFLDLIASTDARSTSFGFFYPFGWGHKEVQITLLKSADNASVYVITEIMPVSD